MKFKTEQNILIAFVIIGFAFLITTAIFRISPREQAPQRTPNTTTHAATDGPAHTPKVIGYGWDAVVEIENKLTIYTFTSDGGGYHRRTSARKFLDSHPGYPRRYTYLDEAYAAGIKFCAVPWDYRKYHEAIESTYKNDTPFHTYRIEFPDRDPGVLYYPIDRVPKWVKSRDGSLIRQRAFDQFRNMNDTAAEQIGAPRERIVIYKRTPIFEGDERG